MKAQEIAVTDNASNSPHDQDGNHAKMHKSHGPRNCWLGRRSSASASAPWPLVIDLSRNKGERAWWAGLTTLMAGLALALGIGLSSAGTRFDQATALADAAETAADSMDLADRTESLGPWAAAPTPQYFPIMAGHIESETADQSKAPFIRTITIGRGDTMTEALMRAGIDRTQAHAAITALSKHYDMRRLAIGQIIDATLEADGKTLSLNTLALRASYDRLIIADRLADGRYEARNEALEVTPLLAYGSGTIDDSLYLSARAAGVPAEIIVELIRLYSFDVDFQREIRTGDRFEILYQRTMAQDDGAIKDGAILYARLNLRGRDLPLYRHTPADSGDWDYFDENGKSVRKALMKTPLDGARLTSRFGKRKHPVLGYVRSHQGVDFGAPTGTPVFAAGDGIIERASRYGSYGNYVRIRHNGTYKTAYAHLSKYGRGIKQGVRVKQGQIIGYVGATGRVTGAHLHYEVYMGEERVDPLTLKLPSGRVLTADALDDFIEARQQTDADRLALSRAQAILLAKAD
jgi:murein DD-endopeptidase MepM/ murein hydrolase activator NlpD